MLRITRNWSLDEKCIEEQFIRASGPGGQNVNKVATGVQLRLDTVRAEIPPRIRARLLKLAGRRASTEGVIVISADRHRSQRLNRTEARERLVELLREAARPPRPRIPTKPTAASVRRRLENKRLHGARKQERRMTDD